MATNATATNEAFSPTTATATATTGTAKGGATGTANTIGSTSVGYAPTVTATGTSINVVTKIESCNCCGEPGDKCCGPFPTDGPYFNDWFSYGGILGGRGKTTAPSTFILKIGFGSWADLTFDLGSSTTTNTDLMQIFELPFEYFDPGASFNPGVLFFNRYQIARWTNTGPIKARLKDGDTWSNYPISSTYDNLTNRGRTGTTWINFESEYLYLVTNYLDSNAGSRYMTSDAASNFVLLSSLENLTTDKRIGVFYDPVTDSNVDETALSSSYKLFFQRWNPDTASVYGYRYVMKNAELGLTNSNQKIARPLTWVRYATGCPMSIYTEGKRDINAVKGGPVVWSTDMCETTVQGSTISFFCNRFTSQIELKREQDCLCPNGYARQLFGPGSLCPSIDFGKRQVELEATLTSLTPVAPFSNANTTFPAIPHSMGFVGPGSYSQSDICFDFCGSNSEWFKAYTTKDNSSAIDMAIRFEVINGAVTAKLIYGHPLNTTNFYIWTTYYQANPTYAGIGVIRSSTGGMNLSTISTSCNPFSMVFSGSIYFGTTKAANIEITFSLPDNGLTSMAPPMVFNESPEGSQLINQSKQRISIPCIHRGQPLEGLASCGCGGAVLTECAIYGKCRPYGTATDAQICTRCEDYEPAN